MAFVLFASILQAQPNSQTDIFDTRSMTEVVIVELQKNEYFKTYLATYGESMILVTDYRSTQLVSNGQKLRGSFVFLKVQKIRYKGTEYELPEYAVYENKQRK